MNLNEIVNVQIDDVDASDWPDLCDAYICSADWMDGVPLTDEELDILNSDYPDFVYNQAVNSLFY